ISFSAGTIARLGGCGLRSSACPNPVHLVRSTVFIGCPLLDIRITSERLAQESRTTASLLRHPRATWQNNPESSLQRWRLRFLVINHVAQRHCGGALHR